MPTDTNLKQIVINRMTKEQFDALLEKDENQIYIVEDDTTFATKAEVDAKNLEQDNAIASKQPKGSYATTEQLNKKADKDEWYKITDFTTQELISEYIINKDMKGNPFSLKGFRLNVIIPPMQLQAAPIVVNSNDKPICVTLPMWNFTTLGGVRITNNACSIIGTMQPFWRYDITVYDEKKPQYQLIETNKTFALEYNDQYIDNLKIKYPTMQPGTKIELWGLKA